MYRVMIKLCVYIIGQLGENVCVCVCGGGGGKQSVRIFPTAMAKKSRINTATVFGQGRFSLAPLHPAGTLVLRWPCEAHTHRPFRSSH